MATRGFYQNTVALASADGTLKALSAINVFVYLPGTTTLVTIYAGRTGASTLTNPIITDATGIVEFYADVGEYDVRFRDTNAVPRIADRTVSWEAVNAKDDGIPYVKIDTGSGIPTTDLALSQSDVLTLLGAYAVQTGDLKTTARTTAPTGWLICDGSAVSRTTFAALWAAISGGHAGTSGDPAPYGNGDGSSTFNLPDLKGRVAIGSGTPTGAAGATAHALGQISGEEAHTLTAAELATHFHNFQNFGQKAPTADGWVFSQIVPDNTGGIYFPQVTGFLGPSGAGTGNNNPSGGGSHNNMQPYQVVNWLIKT